MSGDVQPRKRKDKRRKKEGGSLGSIHEPITSHKFKRSESDDKKVFELPEQGEKIHIQNEHGIGGNICVKIVFFCLFGLLIGAVGLIYMKSLGSTDVDLPTIEESRFAEYFTGWLDESSDDHEHEAPENNFDHEHDEHDEHDDNHEDEHDDEHDEHDDHEEEDDHDNEEDQENPIYKFFGLGNNEVEEAENDVQEDAAESEKLQSRPDVDEDEEEEEEDDEDDNDDDDDDDNEEESEEKEEVDEVEEESEEEEEVDDSGIDSEKQKLKDEDDKEDDEDDEDLSQMDEEDEDKYNASQVDEDEEDNMDIKKSNDKHDEDEDENESEDDDKIRAKKIDLIRKQLNNANEYDEEGEEFSEEKSEKEKDEDEEDEDMIKEPDDYKPDNDDLGFEEVNVSEEDLEDENESKEEVKEPESKRKSLGDNEEELKVTENQPEDEDEESESGGVAVKLGVGIALIIVAHLVLVKKWKSMNNALTDEIASTELNGKKIENLDSSVEPIISRRQTLVPENILLNGEADEEELEEEEEEEEGDDEVYSEDECEEEFKKSRMDNLETFEKLSWNIKKNENEKNYAKDFGDNHDIEEEEEEEYEEDDELVEEEEEKDEEDEEEEENVEDEEEEEEEDVEYEEEEEEEEEDENEVLKQKVPPTPAVEIEEEEEEEVIEATPIPPPRTKTGRGAQDFDEESIDQYEESKVEEGSPDNSKVSDETNISGPEEQKTDDKKMGNEDEWAFRQELDFADEQFENNPRAAVEIYNKILSKKSNVVRALIGRAKALDQWAEKEKSNAHLKQAINAYKTLLLDHGHLLDDETYLKLAERCIERMRFGGAFVSAIDVHKALILKYPNTPKYRNTLAVTYLMLNKIPQARVLLNETLTLWPDDGFALVHYGFILKTSDNNMEEGAKKLMEGIQTRQEGVIDGMFFFHLGDALNRLGRGKEAMEWYELGVKEGLFLNKYQRSLYNVDRLKGQPWWTKEETTYQDFFKKLEENWREIRKEGLELLNSKGINLFKEEAENLKDTGDWRQLDLYFRGKKQPNCFKAPLTCSLVSSFKPAATCTRGQIKFSVILPNTHVWPHCGPTNCRLRSHLGLVVPKKTYIRVAEETRSWEEGKFIIFDDSFEHEVWHNGTGLRLVLIVDVWHPELTNHEKRTLSPI